MTPKTDDDQQETPSERSLQTRWSLIGRLKDWGDQQSWLEFFDSYWKLIYSVALKAGLSDAEAQEVVQETVISVAKKMPEFQADPAAGSFKSWLLTLTRWRITDQLRKRKGDVGVHASACPSAQREADTLNRDPQLDDNPRTATVERAADPGGVALEAIWDEEWESNLLDAATERVKRQVDPELYQLFDFHVLKQWPAKKVARKLGVSLARVYFAKYKVSALLRRQVKNLGSRI
jgi:RNA polymerase sigma-70 factor (ECF subfamily)